MSKFICKVCGEKEPCVLEMVNDQDGFRPMCCPVDNQSGINADWHEVTTDCSQLPKLTVEVFDRPDCPAWAKYAAVSKFGCLTFFEEKPVLGYNSFLPLSENYTTKLYRNEPSRWDATDWQNSLIERPEKEIKLPDWCKPGAWLWVKSTKSYERITEITCSQIMTKYSFGNFEAIGKTVFEARPRPYKAEEIKALVGKVIENFKYVLWCDGYEKESNRVVTLLKAFTAEDLIKEDYTVDGKPCSVLEHLENGEWVE